MEVLVVKWGKITKRIVSFQQNSIYSLLHPVFCEGKENHRNLQQSK